MHKATFFAIFFWGCPGPAHPLNPCPRRALVAMLRGSLRISASVLGKVSSGSPFPGLRRLRSALRPPCGGLGLPPCGRHPRAALTHYRHSLFAIRFSLLASRISLFTAHRSPIFAVRHSLFAICNSLLAIRILYFTVHRSLLTAHRSPIFAVRHSHFVFHCSPLTSQYS